MPSDARPPSLTRVALIGASGRMGQALLRTAAEFPDLIITAAVASPGSLALGRDAGQLAGIGATNLPVSADLRGALELADVAIDFSSANATRVSLDACRAAGKPLLLGTTGFGAELEGALNAAARDIALLVAANTSIGVALLTELTRRAASALPPTFDVDILDLHHRSKQDAPSGTALALGAAAAAARGVALKAADLRGARKEAEIGFATVRAGDIVGQHTVLFSGAGEELSLTHRALDRAIFARGALAAALWLVSRPPGRYGMQEFLGFKTGT